MTGLKLLSFLPFIVLIACSWKDKTTVNKKSPTKFTQFREIQKRNIKGHSFKSRIYNHLDHLDVAVLSFTKGLQESLRVRDYLYPESLPSDEIDAMGGGQNFQNYLTGQLLPKIDAQYRTDNNRRALLGHSFGGYFVLYSLLNQLQNKTNHFQTFISASPTLWYNNFFLNQLPEQLAKSEKQLGIFLSVGGMEDSTWSITPVKNLTVEIQKRNIKGHSFVSRIYNLLDHLDVAVLSFTKGLQELAADKE